MISGTGGRNCKLQAQGFERTVPAMYKRGLGGEKRVINKAELFSDTLLTPETTVVTRVSSAAESQQNDRITYYVKYIGKIDATIILKHT